MLALQFLSGSRLIDAVMPATYSVTTQEKKRNGIPIMNSAKTLTTLTLSICLASLLGFAEPETVTAAPSPTKETQEA